MTAKGNYRCNTQAQQFLGPWGYWPAASNPVRNRQKGYLFKSIAGIDVLILRSIEKRSQKSLFQIHQILLNLNFWWNPNLEDLIKSPKNVSEIETSLKKRKMKNPCSLLDDQHVPRLSFQRACFCFKRLGKSSKRIILKNKISSEMEQEHRPVSCTRIFIMSLWGQAWKIWVQCVF